MQPASFVYAGYLSSRYADFRQCLRSAAKPRRRPPDRAFPRVFSFTTREEANAGGLCVRCSRMGLRWITRRYIGMYGNRAALAAFPHFQYAAPAHRLYRYYGQCVWSSTHALVFSSCVMVLRFFFFFVDMRSIRVISGGEGSFPREKNVRAWK